jgi:hypothetical protein
MKTPPTTRPPKFSNLERIGDCSAASCSIRECEGRCSVKGRCRGEIGFYYTFTGARCWGGSYYCEEGAQMTREWGYRVERVCGTCDGSGGVDSGGVTPWGAAAMDECPECKIFRANDQDLI